MSCTLQGSMTLFAGNHIGDGFPGVILVKSGFCSVYLGGGWLCCWCDVRGRLEFSCVSERLWSFVILQGDSDVSFINHDTVELEKCSQPS